MQKAINIKCTGKRTFKRNQEKAEIKNITKTANITASSSNQQHIPQTQHVETMCFEEELVEAKLCARTGDGGGAAGLHSPSVIGESRGGVLASLLRLGLRHLCPESRGCPLRAAGNRTTRPLSVSNYPFNVALNRRTMAESPTPCSIKLRQR